MPQGQNNQNRKNTRCNTVTNSIKTFKMAHIKKTNFLMDYGTELNLCVWLGSSWAGPDIPVSDTHRRCLCVSPAKIREEARKALLSTRCARVVYNRSSCELKLAQGAHLTQL